LIKEYREIKKGIILAAGDGSRLGWQAVTCPKVLLSVNGRRLVSYAIESLTTAGIKEIAVVVGYLGDKVRETLGDGSDFGVRLHYIVNPEYLGGNAISVHKAKEWAGGEPVVLCMGDHMIERDLVSRLLSTRPRHDTLCVDYTPEWYIQIDEATKVNVDSRGCIRDIGKSLSRWNGLDTGVFLLTGRFFRSLDKLISRLGINIETGDVVRYMVGQRYCFRTCDVSGFFWADVDTEQDLDMAGELG
jgi:choline kinase